MVEEIQVVTIAGSDSDGSAGAQADLHSFFVQNTYGMTILTAAVAGNSYGIHAVQNMPTEFITAQFSALADDFHIRATKTGMLANTEIMHTVVENYQSVDFGPLVVDPVITTKHGNRLLEVEAIDTLKQQLLPLATVTTPNFYEAQILADMQIMSMQDIETAALRIQKLGVPNVMIKGRHDNDDQEIVVDYVLLADGRHFTLSEPFIKTQRINGTGDTLSATITACLAKGESVEQSIRTAKKATHNAIANEIEVGHKFGPINHWAIQK